MADKARKKMRTEALKSVQAGVSTNYSHANHPFEIVTFFLLILSKIRAKNVSYNQLQMLHKIKSHL